MTKLSDTQLVILSTACQRKDRLVLPLPERIKGGAASKVVRSLLAKDLVEEVAATIDQPVWRETDNDRRLTLVATDAAFAAHGITPEDAPQGADEVPTAPPARKTREGSKQARLVEMLERPEGVTIAEAAEALDWQSHTVRGALAGTLKKKLGLTIESEKVEGRGRTYRIS